MVRVKHSLHSVFPWSDPTTHFFSFRFWMYQMLSYIGGFTPCPREYTREQPHNGIPDSSLTLDYHFCITTLQISFPYPHITVTHPLLRVRTSPCTLCWGFWSTLLKRISYSHAIHKMPDVVSSFLLSTSYLQSLIVCRSILLLTLINLSDSVSAFCLCDQSAFCLLMLML